MLQLVSFFHPLKCSYLYPNWCINKSINWFIFFNQGLKKKCFNKRQMMLDSSQWVKQAGRYDKKFFFLFFSTPSPPLLVLFLFSPTYSGCDSSLLIIKHKPEWRGKRKQMEEGKSHGRKRETMAEIPDKNLRGGKHEMIVSQGIKIHLILTLLCQT